MTEHEPPPHHPTRVDELIARRRSLPPVDADELRSDVDGLTVDRGILEPPE